MSPSLTTLAIFVVASAVTACSGTPLAPDSSTDASRPDASTPGDDAAQPSTDAPLPPPDAIIPIPDGGTPDAWTPPIGIPTPPFGLHETAPAAPNPWTIATPGFYYVDRTRPGATDDANTYGTPARPRRTMPLTVPAGSVVEIHGVYDAPHSSPNNLHMQGTADRPVFVRGVSAMDHPTLVRGWEIDGSYYVLENLEFGPSATSTGSLAILAPTTHAALRHCELHGTLTGGGMGVVSWNGMNVDNVLVWQNAIHDNGDVHASYDQDVHGIAVGEHVSYLWVLENLLAGNSGDGIQINGGRDGQASLHHVYVGRNIAHHNKQTGFWVKQAVDVIISQNLSYAHRPSNSSNGAGMGFQYAPERVWFLYNHVHDCEYGISSGSDSDQGTGRLSFFIGNVLHDIHHTDPMYNPDTGWASAGIMLAGGVDRVLVGNTIWDVDGGINSPSTAGHLVLADNLIGQVTEPRGNHVFVEMSALAGVSSLHHALFDGAARIRWGDAAMDLSRFRAAYPAQCTGCLATDPMLSDPLHEDFRPQAGSPAVDSASAEAIYAGFRTLYGIDIARDAAGNPRPVGAGWDIGAFERTP